MLIAAGLWSDERAKFLSNASFEPQDDGEMGSFSVKGLRPTIGTQDYAEAEYTDSDGQLVIIALIGDENGFPTDIDFWKVDSTPLRKFPDLTELKIRKR